MIIVKKKGFTSYMLFIVLYAILKYSRLLDMGLGQYNKFFFSSSTKLSFSNESLG